MSCYSRFPEEARPWLSKVFRVTAFTYPYLFDSIPLFFRLFFCLGNDCTHNATLTMHVWHSIFAFLTGFMFATHLPERLAPGRFDYVGHSHQLFHVFGVMGTYFQMEALIMDMNLRKTWLLEHSPMPSLSGTLGAWCSAMVISLLMISAFSWALYWKPNEQEKRRNIWVALDAVSDLCPTRCNSPTIWLVFVAQFSLMVQECKAWIYIVWYAKRKNSVPHLTSYAFDVQLNYLGYATFALAPCLFANGSYLLQ